MLLSGGPLPRLRRRLADLAADLRYEDAARLRDRIAALEAVIGQLARLDRLRARAALPRRARRPSPAGGAPSSSPAAGSCAVRTLPPGSGARLEVEAGLAAAREALAAGPSYAPEDADELLVVHEFLRRPAARAAGAAARPGRDLRAARGLAGA